jgi:protein SCO1
MKATARRTHRPATLRRATHSLLIGLAAVLPSATGSAWAQPATDIAPGLNQMEALRLSQSAIGTHIGDFTLLDRSGQPVRLSQYRGKPLLVSFIYTACFQVCPLTTKMLQKAVEGGRDTFGTGQYNVVSIGFNQPSDTPQALKSFAQQHRIDQPNWEFLSPHHSIVEPLTQAFGFRYASTPAGFDHILQVTLVDANGRIYRQIYGEELTADSLGDPLKDLMREAPLEEKIKLEDLIERVKIMCTVYDPNTGRYRVRYDLALEIAGGVTFALVMGWFLGAEWLGARRRRNAARSRQAARA